jgi:hypothetical protein
MAKPWSQVEQSPQYQSLPYSDKLRAKEEYWNTVVVKKEEFSKLANTQKEQAKKEFIGMTSTPTEVSPNKSMLQNSAEMANAVGLAGLAGTGAVMAGQQVGKYFTRPWRELAVPEQALNAYKQELGMPQIASRNLPSAIGREMGKIESTYSDISKNLESQQSIASKRMKQIMDNLDRDIISPTTQNVSERIINNYPVMKQEMSNNYAQGLADFETKMMPEKYPNAPWRVQAQQPFSKSGFVDQVIEKTARYLDKIGENSSASKVRGYAEKIQSGTLSFSEAKQAVTNLSGENINASRVIRDNWGQFLADSSNIPKEAKQDFLKLQETYRNFKETIDKPFSKTIRGGVKAVNEYISSYVTKKFKMGMDDLVNFVSKSEPEIKSIYSQLKKIKEYRGNLSEAQLQSKISLEKRLATIQSAKQPKIRVLLDAQIATEKLLSEQAQIASKYPGRYGLISNVAKRGPTYWAERTIGSGLSGVNTLQTAGMMLPAIAYRKDPEGLRLYMLTGKTVPKKGTPERAMFERKLKEEYNQANRI